jgi:hypothetical protein
MLLLFNVICENVRLAPIGLAMGLGAHAWWLGCLRFIVVDLPD